MSSPRHLPKGKVCMCLITPNLHVSSSYVLPRVPRRGEGMHVLATANNNLHIFSSNVLPRASPHGEGMHVLLTPTITPHILKQCPYEEGIHVFSNTNKNFRACASDALIFALARMGVRSLPPAQSRRALMGNTRADTHTYTPWHGWACGPCRGRSRAER